MDIEDQIPETFSDSDSHVTQAAGVAVGVLMDGEGGDIPLVGIVMKLEDGRRVVRSLDPVSATSLASEILQVASAMLERAIAEPDAEEPHLGDVEQALQHLVDRGILETDE